MILVCLLSEATLSVRKKKCSTQLLKKLDVECKSLKSVLFFFFSAGCKDCVILVLNICGLTKQDWETKRQWKKRRTLTRQRCTKAVHQFGSIPSLVSCNHSIKCKLNVYKSFYFQPTWDATYHRNKTTTKLFLLKDKPSCHQVQTCWMKSWKAKNHQKSTS